MKSLRGLALTVTFLAGVVSASALAGEGSIDNKNITLAVEREMPNDAGVPSHLSDVKAQNGVVTLLGWVEILLGGVHMWIAKRWGYP